MKVASCGWLGRGTCCFIILTLTIVLLSTRYKIANVRLLGWKVDVESATCDSAPLSSNKNNDNYEQCVRDYLSDYERYCQRFLAPKVGNNNKTTVKLCPCIPSGLCRLLRFMMQGNVAEYSASCVLCKLLVMMMQWWIYRWGNGVDRPLEPAYNKIKD